MSRRYEPPAKVIDRWFKAMDRLRSFPPEEIVRHLTTERCEQLERELADGIEWLRDLQEAYERAWAVEGETP